MVSEHLAEEAAQEAVIRAWRHAAACRDPGAPGPWIRTIARREALRLLTVETRTDPPGPHESGGEGRSENQAGLAIDLRSAVLAHTDELDRQLLFHRYWAGETEARIAQRLDLPIGTVKVRLHRARARLRDRLTR